MDRIYKIYDVDAALERSRPTIRWRGQDFPLANQTVAERVRLFSSLATLQDVDGDSFDGLQDSAARMVEALLDGVPREMAETVTWMEFNALIRAIMAAVEQTDFEPVLVEKNGRPATAAETPVV